MVGTVLSFLSILWSYCEDWDNYATEEQGHKIPDRK